MVTLLNMHQGVFTKGRIARKDRKLGGNDWRDVDDVTHVEANDRLQVAASRFDYRLIMMKMVTAILPAIAAIAIDAIATIRSCLIARIRACA